MMAHSDLCNKIIPCYRLLLEKLLVAHLVRIFLPTLEQEVSFYRVQNYLPVCPLSSVLSPMCLIFPNLNEKTKSVCVCLCLFWPELESSVRKLS
jgi:hypothetical protein